MHEKPIRPDSPPDASQAALALVHRLLSTPGDEQPELSELLRSLRVAFSAQAAGIAAWPGAEVLVRQPEIDSESGELPWTNDPTMLDRVTKDPVGLCVPHQGGCALVVVLLGADQKPWIVWLEDQARERFSPAEQAAFAVVGSTLARWLGQEHPSRWAEAIEQRIRQQQIEAAAGVARRLAHDFGNVLTGILGFSELALTQPIPSHTPLLSYLQEVHRAAQHGAAFTHQLRLFSRRHSTATRCGHLSQILTEQEARQVGAQSMGLTFRLSVPPDLPAVGIDAESLRQVFGALLDNARESLSAGGSIGLSARTVELDEDDCGKLYGAARPGPHVEVVIADTGSGISAEAQRRVLVEPFFSTRPRHKGFGLAVTYGILAAHRAGLRIHPGEERGTIVRVLLPVAAMPVPLVEVPRSSQGAARGERILVVDDEPDILRYVTTSLEQVGYRVQGMGTADAAYHAYFAQSADPFALVLTDVVMPVMSGVELVRRLVRRDPSARVLFMSGHVTPDFTQQDMTNHPYELLTKPFRAEQLLRTVRTVLDRGTLRSGALGPSLSPTRK
jgi:signal transduction histidine kinase/ActR/RegA family two-component response regulator